jgi:hypothetical protein
MRIPGFTAELALRKTAKTYKSNPQRHGIQQAIRPAALDQECYRQCYDANFETCKDNCPDIPQ